MAKITSSVSPAPVRPKSLEGLPAFPAVARKLMDMVSRESCSMQDVSRLILSDAAFTAEVLRLANSALFGLRYEVVSILHAVTVLGMDRLKALVLTVGMRDFLAGARQEKLMLHCWRHNLACAIVAEWLAPFVWLDQSKAYTAGLLHDLGRLALMMLHPVKYQELVDMAVNAGRLMEDCERIAFGINSCEAGMWVAADWKLPAEMRRVVCAHSKSLKLGEDADSESLASVSCQFSNQLGFAAYGPPGVWSSEFAQSSLEGAVGEKAGPRLHELTEMVPYKINVFECEFFH